MRQPLAVELLSQRKGDRGRYGKNDIRGKLWVVFVEFVREAGLRELLGREAEEWWVRWSLALWSIGSGEVLVSKVIGFCL